MGPSSAYELTKRMRSGILQFWGHAESNLYAEAKRLAADGHARSRLEPVGRRPRAIYSITAKGRRALERWAAEPPAEETAEGEARLIESELLLKIFVSSHGAGEALRANLRAFGERAGAKRTRFDRLAQAESDALLYRLFREYAEAETRWAKWAAARRPGRGPSPSTR